MADNVNIIVQDTINDIFVNAAVVVETIDINVQAAVDVVDIVANPNNYVVNINRIIGEQVQSDWDQADDQAPDYIKNKPTIPTLTSDLTNDGEDGINPFITAADVPASLLVALPFTTDHLTVTNNAYVVGDVVWYLGNVYRCIANNDSILPTSIAYWTNLGAGNPLVAQPSDWNSTTGNNQILNKPTIPDVTGFVPYTGATQDVDLGEFEIKAGQVEFDQTPTGAAGVGVMRWNDSDGTVDLGLKGGNVTLQIGQEQVLRVVNKTATNVNLLEANYQAVRVTGAQGQRLKVDLAQATTDLLSAETIGLVTETIDNNQEGFITTSGLVRGINTTGSLQGETWADGDILYLSPTTAGNATKVKPVAPNHLIVLGYVIHAHITQGSIFVKVDNGYELDELHNVKITSAANNNVLAYTSATDIWENKTINTVIGYTPFQLPALTSGSVLFSNGTTIAQDNANLFWDDTNNRLGIGTATPSVALDLNANYTFNTGIGRILNIKANSGPTVIAGFGTGMNFGLKIGSGAVEDVAYIDVLNTQTFRSGDMSFKVSQGSSPTEAMRISYLGNILLGTSTNAGFKLDVNGTARVSGLMRSTDVFVVGGTATTNTANARFWSSGGQAPTSGLFRSFFSDIGWIPSSGSAEWYGIDLRPSITQSGTATGITRGLYIAPFLTSAVDWRAIEVANGGAYINTTSVQSTAILQADSTTKGFLPPRMTTTQKNAIATPAAGLVVYDTDLKQLCTYNGTWGNSPFYQQSLAGVKYFTDFDNTASITPNLTTFTSGLGADTRRTVVSIPNQTANQIGFSQFQTGTTSIGYATMINEGFVGKQFVFGGGAWVFETFVNVETLSDVTNRFRFMAGFGDSPTNASEGNGVLFTYDEGGTQNGTIASPNWQCVSVIGGITRTLTTTTTAVSSSTWTKLRIEVNAAGTSVTFYVNGTLVATHTTNIPTFISAANARAFNVKLSILKSIGLTNRSVFCDYLLYENNLTTLR
jgi:hypothetical protein